jgi:hypothetical protein
MKIIKKLDLKSIIQSIYKINNTIFQKNSNGLKFPILITIYFKFKRIYKYVSQQDSSKKLILNQC